MARRPRVTQKEVAAKANVSQTLVSLVLSGATIEVAESTRGEILAAAKELGYQVKQRPRPTARQRVIAYIRPVVERGHHEEAWIYDAYDQYYDRIQNLLLEAAYRENYSLIVRPYKEDSELTHWLSEWDVDGVIWHGTGNLVEWIAQRYPTVQLWRETTLNADAVSPNQRETMTLPMDYLYKRGHRRILPLIISPSHNPQRRSRLDAYNEYIETHHLPHWKTLVPESLAEGFENGLGIADLARGLYEGLDRPVEERPSAVIVGDHSALYLMKYFTARGVRIPDEISLVGVDNISASAISHPALTTIDNQISDVCHTAILLLLSRMKDSTAAFRKISITPMLVERESVLSYSQGEIKAGKVFAGAERGFSLLQLITSILIVSILAVLLMVGVQSSVNQSRQAECISNLRNIGTAIAAYIGDHNGNVPAPYIAISRPNISRPTDPPVAERLWTSRFLKLGYIESRDIFYCPSAKPKSFQQAREMTNSSSSPDEQKALMRTYGMRQWWFGNDFIQMASDPKRISLIHSPSEFYIVADSYWSEWAMAGYNLQPGAAAQRIHLRHQGKANLLFLDGHVAPRDHAYFATLHELDRQGIYSGGDATKGRAGHLYYTEPSSL